MKITLIIPPGRDKKKFIESELSECRNIKDKSDRQSVEQGLRKILQNYKDGHAYYWDGKKLEHFDQSFNEFIYHCGSVFKFPNLPGDNKYGFVVMDGRSCTIGELTGKSVKTVWHKDWLIPGKVNGGGQSKERYRRNRELLIKKMQKEIADKMKELWLKK